MATTNPLKEYWRNQQKKVTDRSAVTDTSKLFRVPKQEEEKTKIEPYEIGPTINPIDFIKSDGSDCGKLVSKQLEKINVYDYNEYSEAWNAETKKFEYSKILIGMYYTEGNVWKKKTGYTSIEEVEKDKRYIIDEINKGKAVKVMVDYAPGTGLVGGVNPYGEDHAITVVGYGQDENEDFYIRFYDHGTVHQDLGTHSKNRLYWNEKLKIFKSNSETKMLIDSRSFAYQCEFYILTHVRLNRT